MIENCFELFRAHPIASLLSVTVLLALVIVAILYFAGKRHGKRAKDNNTELRDALVVSDDRNVVLQDALDVSANKNAELQDALDVSADKNVELQDALDVSIKASIAKGNFVSRMSHEIRTPLNAIIGYTSIAKDELEQAKTEEQRRIADMRILDCLTKSEIASRHLLSIINDVLDMSAIENENMLLAHEPFDFKGMMNSLTVLFYSQAKTKNVEFKVIFDSPTEEWFVGDQLRTNQILTNLLSNAVKFTMDGGRVTLSVRQHNIDEKTAAIHFEVVDTGIGMNQEYLKHIWTPFEQAERSITRRFGGTGLGLSITKNLIDLMGGDITVESQPGVGSKFTVDLTMSRTEQPTKNDAYDFSQINALIIDDDSSTCDYIKLLFHKCGAKCSTATSGKEAIDLFRAAQANNLAFNVCLVDWHMPNMDGIDTIQQIRQIAGIDIPMIVVTAYDYSDIAERAAEDGVSMFVSKPLFQSSLFDLLANIMGKRDPKTVQKSRHFDFAGARVLLAEDNMMNMEIAKRILESAGLNVDTAWNGQEAVDVFLAAPDGTYKAILMDIHMPQMGGHEATRAIRGSDHPEAKTIPIIAMTADAFAENVTEAHDAGMNDHIAKPIDIPTLFLVLSKYISNAT